MYAAPSYVSELPRSFDYYLQIALYYAFIVSLGTIIHKSVKISAVGLIACFEKFGSLKIEWPGKDDRHNRHPPKGKTFIHVALNLVNWPIQQFD